MHFFPLLIRLTIKFSVTKEVNSLKLMVDTYSKNPGFGDASKLTGELNTTTEKLNQLHGEEQQLQQVQK